MAEESPKLTGPVSIAPPPGDYNDHGYAEQRRAAISFIPLVSLLGAVARNTWVLVSGFTLAAVTAIITPNNAIGDTGAMWFMAAAAAAATVGIVASYLDDRLSRSVQIPFEEHKQVINARLQGKELAIALDGTLGREIRQNAQEIEGIKRELKSWQERVQEPAPAPSQQIH